MANLPSLWGNRDRSPFRSMVQMQREMDRMFEEFFGGQSPALPALTGRGPSFESEEGDTHYLLSFDVPGLRKEDVKIELDGNMLHVYGERQEKKGNGGAQRFSSSYDHWVTLPANVKADGIEAQLENGVLQLAIPKPEESKSRQIKIGDGKSGLFARLGRNESSADQGTASGEAKPDREKMI